LARGPYKPRAKDEAPAAEEKAAQPATPAPAADAAAGPAVEPTFDDVKAALARLHDTEGLGMEACRRHLQEFGTNRVSAVKKEDYRLFVKQADEKIAQHQAAQQ
jgi:hypothetical protein